MELLLAVYAAVGLYLAVSRQNYGPIPFLATCLLGFGSVAYLGLRDFLRHRRQELTANEPAPYHI